MKPFQKYKRREKHEPHYGPHLRLLGYWPVTLWAVLWVEPWELAL